jgi:hypothetical protein
MTDCPASTHPLINFVALKFMRQLGLLLPFEEIKGRVSGSPILLS